MELVQGGASGLSVLRTFRLLRILKVVRFLPALRYQLVVMLRTMDNVATFFALLILFIFIFRFLFNLFGVFCMTDIQWNIVVGEVYALSNVPKSLSLAIYSLYYNGLKKDYVLF